MNEQPNQNRPIWIDSHCHLEMLEGDVDQILKKSVQQGMESCITIGTDHPSNLKVCRFCQEYERVSGTVGIHPHHASAAGPTDLDWLKKEAADNPKIVGIGECGFDLHYRRSPKADQVRVFLDQLEIAREIDMPVVIHAREADEEVRQLLNGFSDDVRGVFHCFTSNVEQARYVLGAGFYLSFNGISTFPQAQAIRDLIRFVPLDRMLLETDAPYLSPVPFRGKPNVPGNVAVVGRFIAQQLDLDEGDFAARIRENTRSLFFNTRLNS